MKSEDDKYSVTTNACKLCTPLGACVAFKGVRGAISLMHGSQGCSTYIRRYLISHFNEPIDIASSNFSENTAIFGGNENLMQSIDNVIKQYEPELLGIASTCLSETIGDDVLMGISEYRSKKSGKNLPVMVHVSTPAYSGTHINGFHKTVYALVEALAETCDRKDHINIFPSFLSPADLRHIKEILSDFGAGYVLLPDYSETLDGESWRRYEKIPAGGTSVTDIGKTGSAKATIEFGNILKETESAGKLLSERNSVPCYNMNLPVGVEGSDRFFNTIEKITGTAVPEKYKKERGRLIDSYADGHKYIFGKKAVIYGEEDFVASIAVFLNEIGIKPVLCASGGNSGYLGKAVNESIDKFDDYEIIVMDDIDFNEIGKIAEKIEPDLIIGNSKGYKLAGKLNLPMVRTGFPIHDRLGGQRILHIGYRGTQQLFDVIVNTVIERKQESSPVGYSYM